MEKLEKTKTAYDAIFKVMDKYKDICLIDINELKRKSKIHLLGVQLKEVYGLNIEPKNVSSIDWISFGEYKRIAWFGENYNRKISCSIDGSQPEDELLFMFSFSTGPYMFGDGGLGSEDYPTDFFQKFWLELKSYKPDYVDEVNRSLYWRLANAKEMFNSFDDILKKYYELNKEDIKLRRIAKMKSDLEKLENS